MDLNTMCEKGPKWMLTLPYHALALGVRRRPVAVQHDHTGLAGRGPHGAVDAFRDPVKAFERVLVGAEIAMQRVQRRSPSPGAGVGVTGGQVVRGVGRHVPAHHFAGAEVPRQHARRHPAACKASDAAGHAEAGLEQGRAGVSGKRQPPRIIVFARRRDPNIQAGQRRPEVHSVRDQPGCKRLPADRHRREAGLGGRRLKRNRGRRGHAGIPARLVDLAGAAVPVGRRCHRPVAVAVAGGPEAVNWPHHRHSKHRSACKKLGIGKRTRVANSCRMRVRWSAPCMLGTPQSMSKLPYGSPSSACI